MPRSLGRGDGKVVLAVLLRGLFVALVIEEARVYGGSSCCDITRGGRSYCTHCDILPYDVADVNPRVRSVDGSLMVLFHHVFGAQISRGDRGCFCS